MNKETTHPLALREPAYEVPQTVAAAVRRVREGLGSVAPSYPDHVTGKLVRAACQDRVDILRKIYTADSFTTAIEWLTSSHIESDETRRAYADDLRHWAVATYDTTGNPVIDLEDITPAVVKAYVLAAEDRGNGKTTINRRLAALNSLHKYRCWKLGVPATELVSMYDRKKVTAADRDTKGTRALELTELKSLLGQYRTITEFALISLLYANAGRITETVDADIERLRPVANGYELMLDRKGGKDSEAFAVVGDLALILEEVIGDRTRGPVFLNGDGQRWTRAQASALLERMGRRARVWTCDRAYRKKRDAAGSMHSFATCKRCRKVTPHVLRATRLTHMHTLERVPLEDIKVFASHADVSTTLHYIRRADKGRIRQEAADTANNVLGKLVRTMTLGKA